MFQSTRPARGATSLVRPPSVLAVVSIHAPRAGRDARTRRVLRKALVFQSTRPARGATWMIPYFGASVYDDPAVYAKSSPITFIRNVKTPTLIVVGDSDVECPAPQSYEYWHALKSMNVRTQLVVYPHEGHEFSDPAHVLDLMQRMVSWFDDNMPRSD